MFFASPEGVPSRPVDRLRRELGKRMQRSELLFVLVQGANEM